MTRRLLSWALLLLVWIAIAEGVLQLAAALSPSIADALASPYVRAGLRPQVEDPVLETRGNPRYPGHDERGFRNESVPDRAAVVAIGDSQTYGTSVARESAWPSRLAERLATPVYGMGFPGYGPVQYHALLDEALALRPDLVVVAVYLGNDLYDAFRMAWGGHAERASLPADLHGAIERAEAREPLADRIDQALFGSGEPEAAPPEPGVSGPRRFLSDHSKLYGLLRAIRLRMAGGRRPPGVLEADFDRAVAAMTEQQRRISSVLDAGEWRTILTGAYRRTALDAGDVRIEAARDATLALLRDMDERCRLAGARLLVLIVPTKESVFAPHVADAPAHVGLADLLTWEAVHRDELARGLGQAGIPVLDLLPVLRDAPSQPYFENADGHPNDLGHRLIAEAVARWWQHEQAAGG